jgi:uncharacterized membrane protein YidH (DUF202 family)
MAKNTPEVFKGRTKEWDRNEWQGRSRRQVETSEGLAGISMIAIVVMVLGLIVYNLITQGV